MGGVRASQGQGQVRGRGKSGAGAGGGGQSLRVGKSACPRVLDDQKKAVDDQKMIPGRPHDDKNIFFDSLNF